MSLMSELNLPATPAQIAEVEERLGLGFPPALRCLYRRHDGFQVYDCDGEHSAMSANFFATANSNHRVAWLTDVQGRSDWAQMSAEMPCPLLSENEELRESVGEVDSPEAAEIVDHHVCIASDWDGSVGSLYTLDTRTDGSVVCILPNPRFLPIDRFAATLAKPPTIHLTALLSRLAAPEWLADLGLYDESTILMFFSGSRDAQPGRGAGESLAATGSLAELADFPHWRRALSNFAVAPFSLDGRRWATVEHYFQADKFAETHPNYRERFALDSGDPLSEAPGHAARRAGGRKAMPLTPGQRLAWEVRKRASMARALHAKYTQHDHYRAILLATGTAMLTHRPPRARHVQVEHALMSLRSFLRGQ